MAAEIEFHDSTLSAHVHRDGDVVVELRPAYVRVAESEHFIGYAQDVDIRFLRASVTQWPKKLPGRISEGVLKFDGAELAVVAIPQARSVAVEFSGFTVEAERFAVEAVGFVIEAVGARSYIETLDKENA